MTSDQPSAVKPGCGHPRKYNTVELRREARNAQRRARYAKGRKNTEPEEYTKNNRGHKTTRYSKGRRVHREEESRDENDSDQDDSERNHTENIHGDEMQGKGSEDDESEESEERGNEVGMSYQGRMRHSTEESLKLWKAEGEIRVLREKWASAMELIDLLEKTNDELKVELQELKAKWDTYHPHKLV